MIKLNQGYNLLRLKNFNTNPRTYMNHETPAPASLHDLLANLSPERTDAVRELFILLSNPVLPYDRFDLAIQVASTLVIGTPIVTASQERRPATILSAENISDSLTKVREMRAFFTGDE